MSRILIFAEAVTLAHVARPIALSRILRELGHDVCIAAAPAADRWLDAEEVARQQIDSIASTAFLRALERGSPPYDTTTLKRYVEDDLRAIAAWTPDIVIGDFRLSLYISARLAGKPYGAIANAYWSRRYWSGVDAPEVAPLSWLPRRLADPIFRAVYPAAFAWHALPFHRACRSYGVDLRASISGTSTPLPTRRRSPMSKHFTNRRRARPMRPFSSGHWHGSPSEPSRCLSSRTGRRSCLCRWGARDRDGRWVVRSMRSRICRCAEWLRPARAAARARCPPTACYFAEFLPYSQACKRASVVVCNGGTPAIYAALAAGMPSRSRTDEPGPDPELTGHRTLRCPPFGPSRRSETPADRRRNPRAARQCRSQLRPESAPRTKAATGGRRG